MINQHNGMMLLKYLQLLLFYFRILIFNFKTVSQEAHKNQGKRFTDVLEILRGKGRSKHETFNAHSN
jgi:hypothetical protein